MKVLCIEATARNLDLKEVTTISSNNFDYGYGGYGLEINKEYTVMGIVLYRDTNCLYYLIDVNGKPDWFPHQLFKLVDNNLSKHWFMRIYPKDEHYDIYSLWGFDELCNNENFYDQLIERDEEAMGIYFRRKKELEEELSDQKDEEGLDPDWWDKLK